MSEREPYDPGRWVPPDAIVFSGGGPDGISFVGSIRRLEEHPDGLRRVKTIVGSSAGAIVGLMLALGMTSYEMETFVHTRYEDGSFKELDVEGLVDFVDRMGVDDGSRMVSALRALTMSKVRPMSRSSDEDVTFLELAKFTGKSLMVCVTNLEESRGEVMSVDTTPDMGVLLAVRMSFGVPLIFTPVRWRGRTYVDGCLYEFCPTAQLLGPSASSILSVRVCYPRVSSVEDSHDKVLNLPEYMSMLVRAAMTRSTPTGSIRSGQPIVSNTVDIESLMMRKDTPCSFDIATLSLEMNRESILRYIQHGYDSTHTNLSSLLL
jgi:predicted acylesterase/phospholipase RssA